MESFTEINYSTSIMDSAKKQFQLPEVSNISVIQSLSSTSVSRSTIFMNTVKTKDWGAGPILFEQENGSILEEDEILSAEVPVTVKDCAEAHEMYNDKSQSSDEDIQTVTCVRDDEPDPENEMEITIPSVKNDDIVCYVCFKQFKARKNMYSHIRKIHSQQIESGSIICPLCKMKTMRHLLLRKHLETLHNIKILSDEWQFYTLQEFNDWKSCIEKETNSFYIRTSNTKILASNQLVTYYKCHRSGGTANKSNKPTSKNRISSKIGASCPAAMKVCENSEGIHVVFWYTHVGHEVSNGPFNETNNSQIGNKKTNERWVGGKLKYKNEKPGKPVAQNVLLDKARTLVQLVETLPITTADRSTASSMIDDVISFINQRKMDKPKGTFNDQINVPTGESSMGVEKT